ncbi:hypothetical protein NUW58_g5967 [Xylaria curta]|uniref:Uncharacterized protein n=1 Tax=Xylaria curta TaxID=42375 RepID=A0ACC1P0P7_9PEZI|nr:hypothetical protein NUW58_g5967 [Xylaria curta]
MDFFDTVNRAARLHGYPTIEALENDMIGLINTKDQEDVKEFQKATVGLSKMQTIVGSMSLVMFASGVVGQVRMKALTKSFGNIAHWKRYDKTNEVKVLKNFLVQRLAVGAPRELKVKRALGLITDQVFDDKMGKLAKAASLVKLTDAAEFAKGGKFANTPAVFRAAKLLKRSLKLASFLENAGWVLEIAAIVAEVITGDVMKEKLKNATKELAAQRFLAKKLELMSRVYDKFHSQVSVAIGVWVQTQESINIGDGSYLSGDASLRASLAEAYVAMEKEMIGVCDDAVLDACKAEDISHGSWTNEDPSTPATAATVELTEGKGCLWRIRGGFWTVQQPLDNNFTVEPAGLNTPRIQFFERRRTDTKIYLQNISSWTWNKDVRDWEKPAPEKLLPWIIIDFSSKTLKTLPKEADASQLGEGTNWGTRTLDTTSYCNLTKINGWTLFYAPPTAESNDGKQVRLKYVHEVNQKKGFEYSLISDTATLSPQLREASRTKTLINLATNNSMFGGGWDYPKGSIDLSKNKIIYMNSSNASVLEYTIETNGEDMWMARSNFT